MPEITLDLNLLKSTIAPSATPGLDTLDPRFQEIAGLVESGDTAKAAAQVEGLIRENILDIRILGYYLYGAFAERGLGGLDEVMETTLVLLGDNWPAFGPVKKKEMHAEKGFAWFFGRLQKKAEYEESQKGEEWERWMQEVSGDGAQALLKRLDEVKAAFTAKMPAAPKLVDSITKFGEWLKTFEKLVHVEAPPPPPPEPAPKAEVEKPGKRAAPAAVAPAATAAPAQGAQGEAFTSTRPMAEGSQKLQELMDRLAAFEALCKKKDTDRAALAALEIQTALESFDPRAYFPKLFASYYRLLSEHVEAFAPLWETKDTLPWKAREQLFRVDLESFIGGK